LLLRCAAKDPGLIARGAQPPTARPMPAGCRNTTEPTPRPAVIASGYLERF